VRRFGFEAPAAGKTGTSHDAWFAGYTNNLLCIVWVGNDDYTDIEIEGAKAAAPIWAEFMKRAITLPQYSDVHGFTAPSGVEMVTLDKATNLLADQTCTNDYTAAFLDGTAPTESCEQAGLDQPALNQKVFHMDDGRAALPTVPGATPTVVVKQPTLRMKAAPQEPDAQPDKKRGFLGKLFGKKDQPAAAPPPADSGPVQ
jgi:penicillin-binding protein 1B